MTPISLNKNVLQEGTIKVHSEILNDLSSGIYSSPASCIKELINNSFDADANLVTIRVKPIQDIITVIDDGDGMNALDFDNNFAWISKSNKRNRGATSKKSRPLIGKIGIGFIAVNEICDELEIISTKKGEPFKFTARVSFKDILNPKQADSDVIIKANYELVNTDEDADVHYTIINLIGLKETVGDILNDKMYSSEMGKKKFKDYSKPVFKNMEELLKHHHSKQLKTFSEDNNYIQFIIDLASYIPVEYITKGPIEGVDDPVIKEIVAEHKKFNFKVDMDGIYLKKPIFFYDKEGIRYTHRSFREDLEVGEGKEKLKFEGYFYIQNQILCPRELNGVAIRIKNIPIANRYGFETTFLNYPTYTDQLFRNWISGEIYVKEGLEDAMNIDRKSFRETHPHFLALQNFLHQFLREQIFAKDVMALYEAGKHERDKKRKKDDRQKLKRILKSNSVDIQVNKREVEDKEEDVNYKNSLVIHSTKSETKIVVDEQFVKNFSKRDWEYLEKIFIIFEVALRECRGNTDKLRVLFFDKIKDSFGKQE